VTVDGKASAICGLWIRARDAFSRFRRALGDVIAGKL